MIWIKDTFLIDKGVKQGGYYVHVDIYISRWL